MKKLIALSLALSLVLLSAFALTACGGNGDKDNDDITPPVCQHVDADDDGVCDNDGCDVAYTDVCDIHSDDDGDGICDTEGCNEPCEPDQPLVDPYADLEIYKTAVANTAPTTAVIVIKMNVDLFEIPMTSTYNVTYGADGGVSIEYSIDQIREVTPDDASESPYFTIDGSATVDAEGNVTEGEIGDHVVAAALVKYNLDGDLFTYNVSAGVLTANIRAENTEAALGVAIDANVRLTLTVANDAVVAVTLTYNASTSVGTFPVEIVCTYTNS